MNLRREVVVLSLPSALLAAGIVAFLVLGVPRIAADEKRLAVHEMRRVASAMRCGRERDFTWEYSRGIVQGSAMWGRFFTNSMNWRDWNKLAVVKGAHAWGDMRLKDRGEELHIVWVRDGKCVYGCIVDIERAPWAWITAAVLVAALALLIVGTSLCLRRIILYAKTRDDFMLAAAHDLAAPLFALKRMFGTENEQARLLVGRMSRIVTNLREYLRQGGRRSTCKSDFPFARAYGEAFGLFKDALAEQGCDVACSIEPLTVHCDEQAVVQILWNLFSNALKYVAGVGRVSVTARASGGWAVVEFADTGTGMTRRQMRRVFDRHWRSESAVRSHVSGFGIGLAVARDLARNSLGDLHVEPNSPRGCKFILRLPLAQNG